jgi:hypothetical protein
VNPNVGGTPDSVAATALRLRHGFGQLDDEDVDGDCGGHQKITHRLGHADVGAHNTLEGCLPVFSFGDCNGDDVLITYNTPSRCLPMSPFSSSGANDSEATRVLFTEATPSKVAAAGGGVYCSPAKSTSGVAGGLSPSTFLLKSPSVVAGSKRRPGDGGVTAAGGGGGGGGGGGDESVKKRRAGAGVTASVGSKQAQCTPK